MATIKPNDIIGPSLDASTRKSKPKNEIAIPMKNKSKPAKQDPNINPATQKEPYSGIGTIEYLKSNILSGLARPNRYVVTITFPFADGGKESQLVSILCESVELPGMHLATVEDKLWGPIRKVPYLPTYNDLSMVFMCDHQMKIRKLFDQWQTLIGATAFGGYVSVNQDYKMNYYDNFIGEVEISLLSDTNPPKARYTVKCFEAYPIEIVSQNCSYGDVDTYLKMEVKMAYHFYDKAESSLFQS